MKEIKLFLILIFLMGLLLAGCTPSSITETAPTEVIPTETTEPETEILKEPEELVTIRWATAVKAVSPIVINTLVGEYLGFYAEEGLTMEFSALGSAPAVMAALDQEDADIGVGVPSFQLPVVAQGDDLPAINFYEYTYPFKWDWAVLPDSPITDVSQLKGMKVGVSNYATSDYPMGQLMLKAAGLDPETDVEWIAVGEGAPAGVALERGEIDALVHFDTGFGMMEMSGLEFRYLPKPKDLPRVGGLYLQATREFMDEHPEMVIGFGRAVAKSTVFCLENPEACSYAFIQMYPEVAPKGKELPEQVADIVAVWKNRSKIWSCYDESITQWGYILESEWLDEVPFAGLEGQIDDVSVFYTNEFIDEINNFDTEAIKKYAREYPLPYDGD
jgi:NitT/TauT family transport system substrate-binding protein